MHVYRNIDARSRNHCYPGNVVLHITITRLHSCVSCPVCEGRVPYHVVICSPSGSTTFIHIISYTRRFSRNKNIEHKMCLLIFSTTFV